eukprot:CAMPEP_0201872906 /NCGR_PEP_ID=MMETSP0902-20130614/5522_1 /ASSEMBLY_ACC=CAM_ASM_000551 /TAXON_ID=420261 /ORGANISM="Thalassiosira antarctica, Strain CCMP982" /LENGTH=64 /DNA_ID=CAMNT_0048399337 /DNA_START=19 /DNA_END=210 /DNA_ORIENTATION=+
MRDAPHMWSTEESVCGMGGMVQHRLKRSAVMRDVPMEPSKEGSALDMGQSELPKLAVMKDAQIM